MSAARWQARSLRWMAALGLAGCASYHPLPLPQRVEPVRSVAALQGATVAATSWTLPSIERLVLLNNPDLRSVRAQHQVAQAQLLQAKLLPNPGIGLSEGFLVSGPGDATAWSAGISEDIAALITLKPRREAARAATQQIDAELLWQEWQTLAKTRLLYVDIVRGEQLARSLQAALELLEQRDQRLRRSLVEGTSELTADAPLLAATADTRNALDDAQRTLLANRHALNALLGLAPDVPVSLDPRLDLPVIDADAVRESAQDMQRRRPDLVALQLGYQSQEAHLRAAVLAQFPVLSFGYQATQDNSRVRNRGPSLNFDLPIFNHGQGGIAAETATRQQLRDEYIARVVAAKSELEAMLSEQAQTRAQHEAFAAQLAQADHAAAAAGTAYTQGNLDLRSYVDLTTAAATRHAAAIVLQQRLDEQQVAIAALLGIGMPTTLPKDVIPS